MKSAKLDRTIELLKADIERADDEHEPLVFLRKGTAKDALNLLEQKPMMVENKWKSSIGWFHGVCPCCKEPINDESNKNYCGNCGQAVKWE